MIYKESSIDIIRGIVESLEFPVTIDAAVNDGGGNHTLTVEDMYHAQPGFKVTIDGKIYKITDIIPAVQPDCGVPNLDVMKVTGDAGDIVATTFELYKPFFFHGTPIAQGVELVKKNKAVDKVPMAWFYQQSKDHFFESETINDERDITLRLFFLTQGKPETWLSEDAHNQGVKPMRRLLEIFIAKLKTMSYRFDVDDMEYDVLPYYKFGVFIVNRGMEKSLWSDKLSGCELAIPLKVFKKPPC